MALDILVQAYGKSLRRYCRQLLQVENLVDDVYQTALLHALRDLPTFAGRSSLRVWLFTIVRYRCMDALRVARSRSRYVVQDEETVDVVSGQATPEELLERLACHTGLHAALRQLPPQMGQALRMRYFEQLSYEEMARLSNQGAATLRVRVSRALLHIRRLMLAGRCRKPKGRTNRQGRLDWGT